MRQISLGLTVAITSALLGSWAYATEFSLPHTSELDTTDIDKDLSNHLVAETAVAKPVVSSYQTTANLETDTVVSDRLTETDNLYYFTMVMPKHSESFSRLSFSDLNQDGSTIPMRFDLTSAQAFIGTPQAIGRAITTEAWMDETGTFWVEFNPSIPSGTTLTVALKAPKPPSGRSYEYGIAAYTATQTPTAVFVGNRILAIDK